MAVINSMAFPFQKGSQEFPQSADDAAAIRASIIQIITTARGERVMRPDFGCDAFSYVFQNNDESFQRDIERSVRYALAKWEPRVAVDQVAVDSNEAAEPGSVIVTIFYTIIASGIGDSVSIAGGP